MNAKYFSELKKLEKKKKLSFYSVLQAPKISGMTTVSLI